ncbi:NUDIX hydrolase [Jiangella anatolica]|uniref:NUDIX hydrolase n=2 Tax=Jiangella anatolica TaxID=2670374 RepID=A0A2W2BR36_9ACTN|nr:NUDIX hydrolase [Jiangella anatolica]
MAAAALLFNSDDKVLLVEPTYKDYWELPGGAVEHDESPFEAASREIGEELALEKRLGRLLVVDWVPPRQDRSEGLMLVFDGGVLSDAEIARISLPEGELRSCAFCSPDDASSRLSALLARRLEAAWRARSTGLVAYLENGYSIQHSGAPT